MCVGGRFGSSLVSGVELEVDSESQVVAPRLSSSVRAWKLSGGTCALVPWPGIEPEPLHWEGGVLTTGPPGKSHHDVLFFLLQVQLNVRWAPDEQPLLFLQWEWHKFLDLLLTSLLPP